MPSIKQGIADIPRYAVAVFFLVLLATEIPTLHDEVEQQLSIFLGGISDFILPQIPIQTEILYSQL